jgi:hypothetical protein
MDRFWKARYRGYLVCKEEDNESIIIARVEHVARIIS